MCFDGGGFVATAGKVLRYRLTRGGTITRWTMASGDGTTGSAVIEVKTCSYAGFPGGLASITGSAKPTLTSGVNAESTTLTGWTTTLAAGDMIEFSLVSCSLLRSVTLILTVA